MSTLFAGLISQLWPYLAAGVAGLIAIITVYVKGQKAGEDKQKAKEALARAKNLEAIKRAADASVGIRPDDELHLDPHNRDRSK